MSSQYLSQSKLQNNIDIRVNNAVIDNSITVSNDLTLTGTGKITLPSLTTYTQVGTETSPLTILLELLRLER